MQTQSDFSVSVRQDVAFISEETVTKRILEIVVVAPSLRESADRLPVNLAPVVDVSGSMQGEKIAYARQAACHIIEQLSERDQITVVKFASEAEIVVPTQPLHDVSRADIQSRIRSMTASGNTALFSGWLHGVNELAAHQIPNGVNRCLLFSDGQANVGETSVEVLASHAARLRSLGITTSTFGVGRDYNEHLLASMAEAGGGTYRFIEHPRQIPALFREELGELLRIVGRGLTLEIACPSGCSLKLLGDLPHEAGRTFQIPFGEMFAGQERRFYLEMLTPAGQRGSQTVPISLSYVDQEGAPGRAEAKAQFTYASEAEAKRAPRDLDVRRRATTVHLAAEQANALQMAERGQRQEAALRLREAAVQFAATAATEDKLQTERLAEQLESETLDKMEQKRYHEQAYRHRNTRA